MKTLILILFSSMLSLAQVPKATIVLTNGQFINNAPSGRDWTTWKVSSITTYDGGDTLVVDDSDKTRITYYGNWRISTTNIVGPTTGNCNCSWIQSKEDSLVFMFTDANYFEWRGELMAAHGIVAVYWQDKLVGNVDTYDPRNLAYTRNWKIDSLDISKVYKFKLVGTGTKNPLSTGLPVVNHGFRLWKHTVKPPVVIPPPVVVVPPVVIIPPVVTPIDTANYEFLIIRKGRFQVYLDGVLLEGEHNEYEKALERAIALKAKNKTKEVKVVSPDRVITIK